MPQVPTLLIGLGGIGSQVVDNIYSQIPVECRQRVVVHAFDTNINDIDKLAHLKGNITQTSANLTVGEYLNRAGASVKEWFPHNIQILHRKTLTDGAGQIRCVSRLAYHASIQRGGLNNLRQKLSTIFRASGEDTVSSVRIIIVSSMAGGTGSGIFLQTALYLREILAKDFGREAVIVRGAFLLPDTLVQSNVLDKSEWENVRANGYACFKELNAITKAASSGGAGSSTTIELEYKPGQQDGQGRQNHEITHDKLPYDFCFLYDYEDDKGHNLGDFSHYLKQMSNTLYLQLFSPLSGPHFSEEDNFIISLIENHGLNRYCGAGVSSLIYPYEDILTYCALSWSTEIISGQWRKLDKDYEIELQDYEAELQAGVSRAKPQIGKRYMSLLENYAAGEHNHPFFTPLHKSTCILDENGSFVASKTEKFIAAVEELISKVLDHDSELESAIHACKNFDEGKLKNKEYAQSEIEQMEINLEILQYQVFNKISEYKTLLIQRVLGEDCRMANCLGGDEDYRLNVWMMKRSEPLHPVAVRYMLYQIEDQLALKVKTLQATNSSIEKGIKGYEAIYDDHNTEEYVENAADRIRLALAQPLIQRIFENKFDEFIDEYRSGSASQLQKIKKYNTSKLQEKVFAELHHCVGKMLDGWQHYFFNLREVENSLRNELNRSSNEHEGNNDPSRLFVLATKDDKQRIWNELRPTLAIGGDLPEGICNSIYSGLYHRFCQTYLKRDSIFDTKWEEKSTEKMFRRDVLAWCRDTIREREKINLNLISALKVEGNDNIEHLAEKVKRLDNLAQPHIPSPPENSKTLHCWGIHPDALRVLTEQQQQSLLADSTKVIVNDAFSRYELHRYRSIYGLQACDLPKFQAEGAYYQAYKSRIDKLKKGTSVTPHLDKRWHLPAYMEDINPETTKEDVKKHNRAYMLGLIYGFVQRVKDDRQQVWEFQAKDSARKIVRVNGRAVQGGFYELYSALSFNPALVDDILDFTTIQEQIDPNKKFEDHPFYTGCLLVYQDDNQKINILDAIFSFVVEQPAQDLKNETVTVLLDFLQELENYFLQIYGSHQANTAMGKTSALINKLRKESFVYQEGKDDGLNGSAAYRDWRDKIDDYVKKNTSE